MQNNHNHLNRAQIKFDNIIKQVAFPNKDAIKSHSLSSLDSTNVSRANTRNIVSFTDIEAEAELLRHEDHSSNSDWSETANVQQMGDRNVKVSCAYPNAGPNSHLYHEEFITNQPIDFETELHDFNESKIEDNKSSSSSSLSKGSKKIRKISKDSIDSTTLKKKDQKGKKHPWQPAEDAKVLELVSQYGQSWALIAAALGNRTGKQVRDRYLNYLRPDIKEYEFTVEEDRQLLSLYYQLGHKWSQIAKHMPGRTECQVKNRFYAHIKKRLNFPDIVENSMSHQQRNFEGVLFENEGFIPNPRFQSSIRYEERKENDSESINEKKEESYMSTESSIAPDMQKTLQGQFLSMINNDPTDVISYETHNRNILLQSGYSYPFNGRGFIENQHQNGFLLANKPLKSDESSITLLDSLNHINALYDSKVLSQDNQVEAKIEPQTEQEHKQALISLENELANREKLQRYEELVRRKNALEFFYTKTLKEMNDLGIMEYPKML